MTFYQQDLSVNNTVKHHAMGANSLLRDRRVGGKAHTFYIQYVVVHRVYIVVHSHG